MKKVLFNTPIGVSIDTINNKSNVGIIFNTSPSFKIWLVEDDKGDYFGFSIGDETTSSKWYKNSKKEYCIHANAQDVEIFVFDTEKELIEWLKS